MKNYRRKQKCVPFPLFGTVPFNLVREALKAANLFTDKHWKVLVGLFEYVDFNETERIGNKDPFNGWTCRLAIEKFAANLPKGKAGNSDGSRTVGKAILDLLAANLIQRKKVGACYRYRIMIYEDVLEEWRHQGPPADMEKAEYPKRRSENNEVTCENNAEASENFSDSQEFKEEEAPIPTGPGAAAGIAQPMPTEGEGGNKNSQKAKQPDSSLSENSSSPKPQPASEPVEIPERPQPKPQSSEPEPRSKVSSSAPPAVPPDIVPNGYIEKAVNEEASQRAELPKSSPATTDLSLSPKLLAQEFHELFGPEEPTEKLLDVTSLDFFRRAPDGTHSGILMDLMRDEKLVERFPDSSVRGQACVSVVRGAFKILLKTCDEWGEIISPRFLNAPTGQRAISKARTEVCRPSRVVDKPSESQPISEALKSLNPEPEPSEPDAAAEEPKPYAKAWDRDDKPLHPDAQAVLDRVLSGTQPPEMNAEPSYKKAKSLRRAKP